MPLQDIKIRKKIPNIVIGFLFGFWSMYLAPSCWSYFFWVISSVAFIFADQIIKSFLMNAEAGQYSVKGFDVKMTHRDRDGNIKSQSK